MRYKSILSAGIFVLGAFVFFVESAFPLVPERATTAPSLSFNAR